MPQRRRNREVLRVVGLLLALAGSGAAAPAAERHDGETTTPSSARVVLARHEPDHTEADPPEPALSAAEVATPDGGSEPAPPPAGDPVITLPRRGEPDRPSTPSVTSLPTGTRHVPWYRHGTVALAVVLGVIFGLLWLLRRYVPGVRKAAGGPMRVVARTAISPKQSVALLEVGRRYVLVGITADHLTNLGHIQDPDESFQVRTQTAGPRSGERSNRFDELLSHEAAEYAEVESAASPAGPVNPGQLQETMGQLRTLLGRLRTLQEPPAR